jgi:hypothetical protein
VSGKQSADRAHEFWTDQVPFTDVAMTGVIGHRQVADAYLAQLAVPAQVGWRPSTRASPGYMPTWRTWYPPADA